HGVSGRLSRAAVPRAAYRNRGATDHDGRGHGRGRRASSTAAGVRRARGGPVWLLHARHPAHRAGVARRDADPDAGRDQGGAGRQPLPLHRLHEDPRRRRAGLDAHGSTEVNKHEFTVIGRPLPKIDALAKVVGETRYADALVMARMAHGKLLRSIHPHALIKLIDTSRARALPGVYAVITGADLPRVKFGILPVSQDEEALCNERVRMVGDAVAAVAAQDEEAAEADRKGTRLD